MGELARRKFRQRGLVHKGCGSEVVHESVRKGRSVRSVRGVVVSASVYENVSGYRCSVHGFVPQSEVREVEYNVEEATEDNPDELLLF